MLALQKLLVWGLFAFGATYAAASTAADSCANQGELDSMYCDAKGHGGRRSPIEEMENLSTIVFTYTPVEDLPSTRTSSSRSRPTRRNA